MAASKELERDALFAAWSEDRQMGSPKPLRAWIAEHPGYEDDLIQWATDAPVSEIAYRLDADPEGEARTLAIGRKVVAEMRARYEAPLSGILAAARSRQMDSEALAAHLEMSEPLIFKLERRLLRFASIPSALVERLAETLQVSARQVNDYLRQPPTLAAGASYKYVAEDKPRAAHQDFSEAVRADYDLTDAQKAYWLDVK